MIKLNDIDQLFLEQTGYRVSWSRSTRALAKGMVEYTLKILAREDGPGDSSTRQIGSFSRVARVDQEAEVVQEFNKDHVRSLLVFLLSRGEPLPREEPVASNPRKTHP